MKLALQPCSHAAMTGPGAAAGTGVIVCSDVIVARRSVLIHAGGVSSGLVVPLVPVSPSLKATVFDVPSVIVLDAIGRPNTRRPPCSPGSSVVPPAGPGQVPLRSHRL